MRKFPNSRANNDIEKKIIEALNVIINIFRDSRMHSP
jgi:hypothetical protein